jgi:hypothetical protein
MFKVAPNDCKNRRLLVGGESLRRQNRDHVCQSGKGISLLQSPCMFKNRSQVGSMDPVSSLAAR